MILSQERLKHEISVFNNKCLKLCTGLSCIEDYFLKLLKAKVLMRRWKIITFLSVYIHLHVRTQEAGVLKTTCIKSGKDCNPFPGSEYSHSVCTVVVLMILMVLLHLLWSSNSVLGCQGNRAVFFLPWNSLGHLESQVIIIKS